MTVYIVKWDINISANTPEEAAEKALKIQRDESSIATVFEVLNLKTFITTEVDLYQDKKE